MNLRKQKGVTLVALAVTIAVILIIVGISVGKILSQKGLLKSAKEAQNVQENYSDKEEKKTNELINSIEERPIRFETEIKLDQSAVTIEIDEKDTLQLTATVITEEGIDKGVTWSSSDRTIATVDEDGLVTGIKEGDVIITATTKDGSRKKANCAVTIVDMWAKFNRIAKAIALDPKVVMGVPEVSGITENGEEYNIKVGELYKVRYNGVSKRVRVLGFKHDDLVNTSAYGSGITTTKASISFELYDFIAEDIRAWINKDWAASWIRKDLNGYTTSEVEQGVAIGGWGAKLSNSQYIKQVKKKSASTNQYANDYLWLLSGSEISVRMSPFEGNVYAYYRTVTEDYDRDAPSRVKFNGSGNADCWWLRSPGYASSYIYYVNNTGRITNDNSAGYSYGVAPGFCI